VDLDLDESDEAVPASPGNDHGKDEQHDRRHGRTADEDEMSENRPRHRGDQQERSRRHESRHQKQYRGDDLDAAGHVTEPLSDPDVRKDFDHCGLAGEFADAGAKKARARRIWRTQRVMFVVLFGLREAVLMEWIRMDDLQMPFKQHMFGKCPGLSGLSIY
jgi:hypothetical protein